MARKKANYDVEEKIEPMKPDAMNPPENFEVFENGIEKKFENYPCNLPSNFPTA